MDHDQPEDYEPQDRDSVSELTRLLPVWEAWIPNPREPSAISVHAKLLQNNHTDVRKCTVDPQQARSLSDMQGIPPETGFWLIPPTRAPQDADVRIFSCGERCEEAGTTLMIPEFSMGYPAARGSIVLVKKGVAFGLGVLRTDIFDQHVSEGRPCCCKAVVMLKSTQIATDPPPEMALAVERPDILAGPVTALEQYASSAPNARKQGVLTKQDSIASSVASSIGSRRSKVGAGEAHRPQLPSGRFSMAAAKRADVARRASGK
ncbi:hypothetical protein HDU67_004830 [Dinochytrium kinnereticum]|nr:hypothetical protein HDU67_004830 [Dinochytrium kinnereticum]